MIEDFEQCYRVLQSRDDRFDGWFFAAVSSTGIYCRPSCPAVTPKPANVAFHPSAASAQGHGYRACLRCRPDASPGSPEWNLRADLAGRAMRLIADGVVDRDGVGGLARRLGYSERQLHRHLVAEVGAGPIALARAQRADAARLLIETTDLPLSQVAFGAGFASIRQFNDTIRAVFARTPTELRRRRRRVDHAAPGSVTVRLPFRAPFDGVALLAFLGARAVAGVEELTDDGAFRRTLRLPRSVGVVELRPQDDHVQATLRLGELRDLASAVERCRRLLDLDADPLAVADCLGADQLLGPLVARSPGRRVVGAVDGAELAVRAVLGQQVSVAGARTLAGRLVASIGTPLPEPDGALTHVFPDAQDVAEADLAELGVPGARRRALRAMGAVLAEGPALDPGADRDEARRRLLDVAGIGPWTVSYVAMRALADPDAFLPTDLGVRHALAALGSPDDPKRVAARAQQWRPWRAYALQHLWASLPPAGAAPPVAPSPPSPDRPNTERAP